MRRGAGVLGRVAGPARRERGREALVVGLHRNVESLPEQVDELVGLPGLLAPLAPERQRQAPHHPFGFRPAPQPPRSPRTGPGLPPARPPRVPRAASPDPFPRRAPSSAGRLLLRPRSPPPASRRRRR